MELVFCIFPLEHFIWSHMFYLMQVKGKQIYIEGVPGNSWIILLILKRLCSWQLRKSLRKHII